MSEGNDNGKPAEFLKIVEVTPDQIFVTKKVKYKDTSDYFVRNKYTYNQK